MSDVHRSGSSPLAETPTTEVSCPTCRVLLADDHELSAIYAAEVLRIGGCTVMRVQNGLEVLALLDNHPFDAVFLDINMPEMDGRTTVRELRARERARGTPRLPVIAITASAFPHEVNACLEAGVDEVLTKPFTVHQLKAVFARWVS